jgi:hypothetical protein
MKNVPLSVILGHPSIRAYVAAPRDIKLLGVVRMGMEFGLLGIDCHGNYVRVNGSLVRTLQHRQVEHAIRSALAMQRPAHR